MFQQGSSLQREDQATHDSDQAQEAALMPRKSGSKGNYRAVSMAITHPPKRSKKRSGARIKGSKKKGGY